MQDIKHFFHESQKGHLGPIYLLKKKHVSRSRKNMFSLQYIKWLLDNLTKNQEYARNINGFTMYGENKINNVMGVVKKNKKKISKHTSVINSRIVLLSHAQCGVHTDNVMFPRTSVISERKV
jgi:hypothetical protein